METMEATTTNNPILAEGVRRCAHHFTQKRYGHHDFTELERNDVLNYAHSEVLRWLQATGCLAGFNASDAIDHSVAVVLAQREPKPELKTFAPSEWTLGTVTIVLSDKLFAKVKKMLANEIDSLASMLRDYPEAADLVEEHKEGVEALRDFEAAANR